MFSLIIHQTCQINLVIAPAYEQQQVIKLSMWKTPEKSPATTVPLSEAPGSARSDFAISQPIQFPSIIEENPQYLRLYEKIHRSQEKAYESITEQEENQELRKIKSTITNKLLQEAKQKSFYKKFGKIMTPQSSRKVFKNAHRSLIGLTEQEENHQKLISFLIDHRKAVELQEQARLVEYHLMDQEKIKTKIDYLNRVELTDKHRRTQPHSKDRESKLFRVNNEMNYRLLRKTAYIRNDKLMSESLASAKNNPTYCRMQNFQQIQYILNEDNRNLMITREIPRDAEKQIKYNKERKLFLSLAFSSDSMRTYYEYIREKEFSRIVSLIVPEAESEQQAERVTKDYLMGLIRKLIKYKQLKVIHFQDFIEILTTIKQERGYDIFRKISQKSLGSIFHRRLLRSQLDQMIEANKGLIHNVLKSSKFEVIVKKIYEMQSNRIVGREYLPLRDILEIMKNINIVPKVVTMSKFMYNSYWYERRRQGFNFEEFIQVQVAIGMEMGGVVELENYFRLFDVKEILAG